MTSKINKEESAMQTKDCLFEIGCEELPAGALVSLSQALARLMHIELTEAQLDFHDIHTSATPRRLVMWVQALSFQQPDRVSVQLGPALSQAYDAQGQPTPACLGFARACGVSVEQLERRDTDKGPRVAYELKHSGKNAIELLPILIRAALSKLPIPKPMRWGNHPYSFVRPVHWAVLLYGEEVIEANILGLTTSRNTYGHRFMHPQALSIAAPREYKPLLMQNGYVIVDLSARREHIQDLIAQCLQSGEQAVMDAALLDEVNALVEWPVALRGQFKSEFLQIPQEVLIASMQMHQKCFPIINVQQQLQPGFIVISNIFSRDPNMVIRGNERVMNARLSDAAFFYRKDCQQRLSEWAPKLHHVVFQQQLGSVAEKVQRLVGLAEWIARVIDADVLLTGQAAALAKCDLLSEMVGEFPNLQGIMGYYYALNDHLPERCALAIKQHYWPRFAGDSLPEHLEGTALALADRIDTLIGILGISLAPTGDKDPFALRRAALGVCRLLIEKALPINLIELMERAKEAYQQTIVLSNQQLVADASNFILQRLKFWYADQGIGADVFAAVLALGQPEILLDFDRRLRAVAQFKQLEAAAALAAANKRVSNILKKCEERWGDAVETSSLVHPAEQRLAQLINQHSVEVKALCQQQQYAAALTRLAVLKPAVDDFFDQVMVMVDDRKLRLNRLTLLFTLRQLFMQVADIALLQ